MMMPALAELATEPTEPLIKVLDLMDDLSSRVISEGEKADEAYRDYAELCDNQAHTHRSEITTLSAKQEKLEASIAKLTGAAMVAGSKIEELGNGLAGQTAQLADATAIREKEAAEFAKDEDELMDTVDTLGRAVGVIKKQIEKDKGAFAQVDMKNFNNVVHTLTLVVDAAGFPAARKQKLIALVQSQQGAEEGAEQGSDSEDGLDAEQSPGAPAPVVYASKSSGITDVMEDLREKADDELQELRGAETQSKRNYAMLKQSLQLAMSNADSDMKDAKARRSKDVEAKAAAQGELQSVNKALLEAKTLLADTKRDCMEVAADHEKSTAARKEELEIIMDAKKSLQDSMGSAASLLQTASRSRGRSAAHSRFKAKTRLEVQRAEIIIVVSRLARTYHSVALSQLASRISAELKLGGSLDPFAKIRRMISDLIMKLEAQAEAAIEEKAYCDDEMKKTKEKKGELEEDLDKLTTKVDKAAAKSASLKGETKELQAELATLAKMQASMDKIRKEEKAVFLEEKASLIKALGGVRRALTVLRQYFGKSEAASLLQNNGASLLDIMRQPKPLTSFRKSEGAGSGIIGVLEVCESDFTKELSKITIEEEDSQANFEEETQANKKDREMKTSEVEYKVRTFKGLDKALADMAEDKDTFSAQQSAVLEYLSKITDRCVAKPEPYEERKQRREQEIAGLKEALAILESEPALVQRDSGRSTQSFLGVG